MILLTAFKGERNSSNILLDMIKYESESKFTKKLLTNSFEACEREFTGYLIDYDPKYIISLGRKPRIRCLCIELFAVNGTRRIKTGFDVLKMTDSLTEHGIRFKLSERPGNYLCNYVYYKGLDYIEQTKSESRMVFIHVPDMKFFQDIYSVALWLDDFCEGLI